MKKCVSKIFAIILLLLIGIVLGAIAYYFIFPRAPSTSFSKSDYKYIRAITIRNSGSDITDYQVLVTLDTASLISQGKMRSDCGDIRFTDSDEVTQLSYWIESGCNSNNTRIWVKVPRIPARSTKNIYLYYGNPNATLQSNGSATLVMEVQHLLPLT